ncbi:malonate decarboxylase subunit alpha [Legionella lytica]|uniref:Malonate decarboxylase subunit alpha n=2 Tax=Legionella lytica TaxID=96232 RepID=A0ABY4YAD3_9GAMM|nr:malonate decarboxylase subunit alpha [Legionella lytica]USQ14449.1 malonate decarboxylase subunit alpha [Legionella lytica]
MDWNKDRQDYEQRLTNIKPFLNGKIVLAKNIVPLLEAAIKPYDKVSLEGDNQKQVDFLARSLLTHNP